MTRAAATLLLLAVATLLLLAVALACGKYGPPVRAGQARAAKAVPKLEVPLPASEPEPAPPVEPADEIEAEPPPEGAP